MLMQIFTPNYFATNVIENCALLPQRAFQSNWLEVDSIEQKGLLLFITRSIRPLVVQAGTMFQMNIYTFLRVI